MPERAAAETAFNKFQRELEELLGEMTKEYQGKLGRVGTVAKRYYCFRT